MKQLKACIVSLLLVGAVPALAKPGCMDNSWHLKRKFDDKTYHYVECNCPCDSWRAKGFYAPLKHKCLECGHTHEARTTLILPKIPTASPTTRIPTVQSALGGLMKRYKSIKS